MPDFKAVKNYLKKKAHLSFWKSQHVPKNKELQMF